MRKEEKGSLACHIYCDTGHLFIMVISEETHTYYQGFGCHYQFKCLKYVATGIRTLNLILLGLTDCLLITMNETL